MKQGSRKNNYLRQKIKVFIVVFTCMLISACSMTSLKSYDTSNLKAANEVAIFLASNCHEVEFGDNQLLDAKNQIQQAVNDYGFRVVESQQADFMLNFVCRKESDLNFGIVPNGISGMIMVASITFIPTYWPSDLWVDMEVYDLRGFEAEQLETFNASFVSQERVVWAPFILFKIGYDLGLPKYNLEKFYQGLKSSTFNMLSTADSKSTFE